MACKAKSEVERKDDSDWMNFDAFSQSKSSLG